MGKKEVGNKYMPAGGVIFKYLLFFYYCAEQAIAFVQRGKHRKQNYKEQEIRAILILI